MGRNDAPTDQATSESPGVSRDATESECSESAGGLPIVDDEKRLVPAEFDADQLVRDAISVARGELSDQAFDRKYGDGTSESDGQNG